jgi:hypothetical protein
MSALAPDKYGVQFLKRYKIEEDIVQLKSDVGKLCPADQTLVSVLAPTSMDQISIICPACGADNRYVLYPLILDLLNLNTFL